VGFIVAMIPDFENRPDQVARDCGHGPSPIWWASLTACLDGCNRVLSAEVAPVRVQPGCVGNGTIFAVLWPTRKLGDAPSGRPAATLKERTHRAASASSRAASALDGWLRCILPALLYGVRLWAAVCLALFVAFRLELSTPSWAGTSAAIVCQPVLGASLRKGWFRLVGTVIGAVAAVVLSACFPQSRTGFLLGLALWGGVCALVATLLRNFASYAAALAGYTAAIIAGDELGAVGGPSGDAFNLALARGTEICVGIVCAGVVLATTDLGGTRKRLATLLAGLTAEIADGLLHTLDVAGPAQAQSRLVRRQLVVRVSGLDAVIDQAAGEIATLPFRPLALQAAVEGLFVALLAWRSAANQLEHAPETGPDAARVRQRITAILPDLRGAPGPARWSGDPLVMRRNFRAAARHLLAMPAETPSLRLLADCTAEGLLGLYRALTGVMVLGDPRVAPVPRRVARLRMPDVLPALVNAVRAFLTIGCAALAWIWLAWPSGATFIIFAAVAITLFAPQEDAAYATARSFTVGTALTAVCAAIVAFAILPQISSFAGFCAALGLVLVPAGALSAQPWQPALFTALEANFVPLLAPSNPMTYDQATYYNTAMALLAGIGLAMLAFRLLPPMPPGARARRLLALSLRDLRRLSRGAGGRLAAGWNGRLYGRLSAIPSSVDSLQAARLAAALSVGGEIMRLCRIARRFGLDADLEGALAGIAAGDSEAAVRGLGRFDQALAAFPPARPGSKARLRARGMIRSVADALTHHAIYFDARIPA
jgi:uncharacterized membrane protein YccC